MRTAPPRGSPNVTKPPTCLPLTGLTPFKTRSPSHTPNEAKGRSNSAAK